LSEVTLRDVFGNYLVENGKKYKNIIVLDADLSSSTRTIKFAKAFPERFFNMGIAEQNMVGVACGLAIAGKKPYCYSNAIFLLFRPYEFIRDDVCYNNLNVKLIGTGSGGFLGFTHNLEGTENINDLLRNLPNIDIWESKNPKEVKLSLEISYQHNRPTFIKL